MKKLTCCLLPIIVFVLLSFKSDNNEKVDLHMIALIKNEGFGNTKVMQTLFELTDVNGPRLTGSTGMKNAEQWAKDKLASWGLANAAIEPWGSFGKGWEVNKCYLAMTAPYYQQLIAVPRAWTPGTNGLIKGSATMVKIETREDMDKYTGKLKDKIAVMITAPIEPKPNFTADATRLTDKDLEKTAMDPHTEEPPTTPPQPRGAAKNFAAPRAAIDSFLMSQGVVAVLSGGRGTMGTVFTSNGASRAWEAKPVLPELEMGSEHIGRIQRLLEAGKEVTLEMDTRTTYLTNDSIENNVVAEIRGTDPKLKDELVLLGGHMDSWHAATGATDNGAGTVVAMEAVRILKALDIKP